MDALNAGTKHSAHFKTITCITTAHIWSVSEGNNALFIGLKISAKFSYRADTDNRKKIAFIGRYWLVSIVLWLVSVVLCCANSVVLQVVSIVLWLVNVVLCSFCYVAAGFCCVVEILLCSALLGQLSFPHKCNEFGLKLSSFKKMLRNFWIGSFELEISEQYKSSDFCLPQSLRFRTIWGWV